LFNREGLGMFLYEGVVLEKSDSVFLINGHRCGKPFLLLSTLDADQIGDEVRKPWSGPCPNGEGEHIRISEYAPYLPKRMGREIGRTCEISLERERSSH
jgi:hypothetical protein